MDLTAVIGIASSVIVSVGGAGAIIISVATYLTNRIAIRLEDKYQLKLDKELEQYKAVLEQRTYVTKKQFDIELEIYRNLTKGIFEFIVVLNTTMNVEDYPRKDLSCPVQKLKEETSIFNKMVVKAASLQELLYSNAGFMPKQLFDECKALIELTTDQFWIYNNRFHKYLDGEICQEERITDADREVFDTIEKNYDSFM
ncbi:MAG TPA: hypothetical protein DDW34_12270 [Clostridium sp.]|nr:hypothetical protein [Clostridium sp.]